MKNLLGGLIGAITLNIIHEVYKRIDVKAPRIDLVGEEGLNKIIEVLGHEPLEGNNLFFSTLGADIAGNTLYYSLIGKGNKKGLPTKGLFYGLAAGIGAVTLTKKIGLSDAPVTRFNRTKIVTVLLYTLGGFAAGTAIKKLN